MRPVEDIQSKQRPPFHTLQLADSLLSPPFPTSPPPPTPGYKYEMPVALQDLNNSPVLLQRSTLPDFPLDEDTLLAHSSNYISPLPELPQAPPPPLQLAYIPSYPTIYTMSNYYPEPPILHKVWILDCKSCGKFLTNRGMKVCPSVTSVGLFFTNTHLRIYLGCPASSSSCPIVLYRCHANQLLRI